MYEQKMNLNLHLNRREKHIKFFSVRMEGEFTMTSSPKIFMGMSRRTHISEDFSEYFVLFYSRNLNQIFPTAAV